MEPKADRAKRSEGARALRNSRHWLRGRRPAFIIRVKWRRIPALSAIVQDWRRDLGRGTQCGDAVGADLILLMATSEEYVLALPWLLLRLSAQLGQDGV